MTYTKRCKKASIFIVLFLPLLIIASMFNGAIAGEGHDLAGIWAIHFQGVEEGCGDVTKNGAKSGPYTVEITQDDNVLYGMFVDHKTTNIMIGKITGNSLKMDVSGIVSKECNVKTTMKGDISNTNQIKGTYTGGDVNCGTCKWKGSFVVNIEK